MTQSTDSDPDQLVRQARQGDERALGSLLEQYRNYLTLLARLQIGRRLQGKVDAGDVVQDVFMAAHRAWPNFRGTCERELAHWLREILGATLANTIRHYLGTQRRDVRLERELAADLDESSRCLDVGFVAKLSSPSQQASRREQAVILADALDQLPPDYREVLILRHLEGLAFPEVAQRMERTLDSVKKLWTRALDRLRRALGGAE